ncbi:MAG: hypothetical protein ACFFD9_03160, partial [Candidatus Thorarchaeota archaeon]
AKEITILGLVSGSLADGIGKTMHWPARSHVEPYAVLLPEVISKSQAGEHSVTLRETSWASEHARGLISDLWNTVHSRTTDEIGSREAEISVASSRLEQRIEVLRKEVDNLQFRIAQKRGEEAEELKKTRDARMAALKRDESRLKSLRDRRDSASRELLQRKEQLGKEIEGVKAELVRVQSALNEILVPGGGIEIESPTALLLMPFIVAGFSKKGRLRVSVYPPSKFMDELQRVGRRREFVDVLEPAFPIARYLAGVLAERANSDVGLRKTLRDSSRDRNLLGSIGARKLIREGVQSLISDGFAKKSIQEALETLLAGIPETKLKPGRRVRPRVVSARDGMCEVKFHIHDDSGASIVDATVELGVFKAKSDSKGVVRASLPRSSYEGHVSAFGFKDRTIEFTLRSADDVVIPIVLSPLTKEEVLDQELDRLVERARRIEQIRERLWEAFEKQGSTLLTIPAYRSALVDLLSDLGYEPEAWIAQAKKKRGMVKGLLKRDDRTDGIRRDILRLAEDSRQAGGIMLLSELLVRLDKMGWATSSDETEKILEDMSKEGLVQGTTMLESGALLVKFVPVSLTSDPHQILSLASGRDGKITIEDAVVNLGWNEERVRIALDLLVENGVAKVQKSYSKSTQYWFPGLRKK